MSQRPADEPIDTNVIPEEIKQMQRKLDPSQTELVRQLQQDQNQTEAQGMYAPTTTGANYDPANTMNSANQNYQRGEQGYMPADAERSSGYTYRSDNEYIAQRTADQGGQEVGNLPDVEHHINTETIGRAQKRHYTDPSAPDNEKRAAVTPEGGSDQM